MTACRRYLGRWPAVARATVACAAIGLAAGAAGMASASNSSSGPFDAVPSVAERCADPRPAAVKHTTPLGLADFREDARPDQDPSHSLVLEVLDAVVRQLGESEYRVSRRGDPVSGVHPHMLYGISSADGRSAFMWVKVFVSDADAHGAWQAERPGSAVDAPPFHGHPAYKVQVTLDQHDWATTIGRFVVQAVCNRCLAPADYLAEALYAEGEPRGLFVGGPIVVRVSAPGYVRQTKYVDNSDQRAVVVIGGRVTATGSGEALADATVEIAGGAAAATTASGPDGAYSITANVSSGTGQKTVGNVDFALAPDVAAIVLLAEPPAIGVLAPGVYTVSIVGEVRDAADRAIRGLTPTFTVDAGGAALAAALEPGQTTTGELGLVFYTLRVTVGDLAALPGTLIVRVRDARSGVEGMLPVSVDHALFEVAITDPADDIATASDRVTIRGAVTGVDPDTVQLAARVSGNGRYVAPPGIALDAGGLFGFRVGLLTAGADYTIEVVATDDQGSSHSDSVNVTYVGWGVEVLDIKTPDRVAPGEVYEVIVKMRYSAPEATKLELLVWPDYEAQGTIWTDTVEPGVDEFEVTFSFEAPGAPPDLLAGAQQPGAGGVSTITFKVVAGFPSRTSSTSAWATTMLDRGLKGGLSMSIAVPIPARGELKSYSNLTYTEWLAMRSAHRTMSRLIRDKGIGFEFVFANTGRPAQDPPLTFTCPNPPVLRGFANLDWDAARTTFVVPPGRSTRVTISEQFKGVGPDSGWLPPRVPPYWVAMDCEVTDGTHSTSVGVRDAFYVGSPWFEMSVETLASDVQHAPKGAGPAVSPHGTAHRTAASEVLALRPDSPIAARWVRIGGNAAPAGSAGIASTTAASLEQRIFLPYVSKPIVPVRLVLDWDDAQADVDLHVFAPDGRSIGGVYGYDTVRNNVPRAAYGGPDTKPQWVSLYDPEPGDYLLVAYAPGTDRTLLAELSVDGYLGPPVPEQPTPGSAPTVTASPTPVVPTATGSPPATSIVASPTAPTPTVSGTAAATTTRTPPPSPIATPQTPTSTARPSPSATVHATHTPTGTDTPSPSPTPSCRNILANGDFEQGLASWQYTGEVSLRFGDFGGGRYAAMVGGRNLVWGSLSQDVTIPNDVASITLAYRWRVVSAEPAADPSPYDRFHAMSPLSPDLLYTWETLTNASVRDTWLPSAYTVSASPGPLGIRFEGETSPQNPTEFSVDDVRITVCTGSAPVLPSVSVQPSGGVAGSAFTLGASGFRPGENATVWVLDPSRSRDEVGTQTATVQGDLAATIRTGADWQAGVYDVGIVGHDGLLPASTSFVVTASGPDASRAATAVLGRLPEPAASHPNRRRGGEPPLLRPGVRPRQ